MHVACQFVRLIRLLADVMMLQRSGAIPKIRVGGHSVLAFRVKLVPCTWITETADWKFVVFFCRAMHVVQSAVLLSQVVRLSVCLSVSPSVRDVDVPIHSSLHVTRAKQIVFTYLLTYLLTYMCWISSKLIRPIISLGSSLLEVQGEHPKIRVEYG